jgi:hypothetical protein
LQNLLSKIIKEKNISFFKQDSSSDIQLYSWTNITCFIEEEMTRRRMATMIKNSELINSIKQECKLSRKQFQNDFYNLLLYMVNQFFRTEKISKTLQETINKGNEGLRKFGFEQDPQKVYFLLLHILPINLGNYIQFYSKTISN